MISPASWGATRDAGDLDLEQRAASLIVQSLPPASVAPFRSRLANGYCHLGALGAQHGDAQRPHLTIVRRPERLHVGDDAEAARSAARRRGRRP